MDKNDLKELLQYIDPSCLDYAGWVQVGMCLKQEGFAAADWENWSARDVSRYHAGECERKWNSFQGNAKPVAAGTLVDMAKQGGWVPLSEGVGEALDWDAVLTGKDRDEQVVIDKNWIEGQEVQEPVEWHPKRELVRYLEAIFEPSENVGYCVESYQKEGRWVPTSAGVYSYTAGQLIELLNDAGGDDIGAVIGDYNQEAGAWIRFNPLDGKGVKNANVTEFRFALIESDSLSIEKQNAIVREMQLPVAALVHSGKKSLHAIVRIDAKDYDEYRKRVDFVYQVCEKNGLQLDKQNRNPSRLSRMPGVMRAGRKQFIVETNIGKSTFADWKEYIESVNDDLPDFENLANEWDNLPELAPALINGVLRQGHKMLISGPSKAGKSFALIELVISIAEKLKWMGWQCAQGKIVYVNFELDRASCLHRFRDVYGALGIPPKNLHNIDIWNLRGKSIPMDALAPKLIRRAAKVKPMAIVLDPIYKVITGDENSADQMAKFCNQFDKVCNDVGCAVIYCHHHSKGAQGGKKSMDRASGSGVFARDPDALMDLIELPLKDSAIEQEKVKAACKTAMDYMHYRFGPNWCSEDERDIEREKDHLLELCKGRLQEKEYHELMELVDKAEHKAEHKTAWRIEGTLREFESFQPVNVWFDYPIHVMDGCGALGDIRPEIEVGGRVIQPRDKTDGSSKAEKAKRRRQEIIDLYTLVNAEKAFNNDDSQISLQDMLDRWNKDHEKNPISRPGLRKRINEFGDFETERQGRYTYIKFHLESPRQEDKEE